MKVHRNTAFIKGMFNSQIEVAKFQGAQLRTVSGIRGQIKKAVKQGAPEGVFRATFEDKILKSDLVFCKTWFSVDLPKLYNPAVQYGETRFVKSHAELRKEKGIDLKMQKDSVYVRHDEKLNQERDERVFAPMDVPKSLKASLPFKSKEKVKVYQDQETADLRRRENLLQALDLPTKNPFKKMFMNDQEK